MWKDELKGFYKYLEDNKMINGLFGSEAIIDNFFNSKVSLKTELLNKLSTLPELITQKSKECYDLSKSFDEANLLIKSHEVATYNIVESEKDESGKNLFSNESKRKIETDLRLNKDISYQDKALKSSAIKKELDEARLKLDYLNNLFKSARAMCLILGVD